MNPNYPGMQNYYNRPPANYYQMQANRQQYVAPPQPQQQKKKIPFHLIACPVSLKTKDTDIHRANFNPDIAIVNFQLFSLTDVIFSVFMNVRETEHPDRCCTQKLKVLGNNNFEKHFKITASPQDPKEDFNVYLEAPIDLVKLSEVQDYEEGTVMDTHKYHVVVRLVILFYYLILRYLVNLSRFFFLDLFI